MPYGRVFATLTETKNGPELTIHVGLPATGEPAKSGNSDNLTDPKEWTDVVDECGVPTEMRIRLNVTVPYRRAARLRRRPMTHAAVADRFDRRSM
jgi:hypothetical protein